MRHIVLRSGITASTLSLYPDLLNPCQIQTMSTSRLHHESGRLPRCTHRLQHTSADTAPPYELSKDRSGNYTLKCPAFHVDGNVITILETDADPDNCIPDGNILPQGDDIVTSQMIPFAARDMTREDWLEQVGMLIAAVMFGIRKDEGGKDFTLANFPDRYVFYLWEKTWDSGSKRPRTDVYLRASEELRFASPLEFARHAMWLMDGMPVRRGRPVCICKYCAPRSSQEVISAELRVIGGMRRKRDLELIRKRASRRST
ncbi:unnamed protein product [Peniophora sp. CBMAI 1063]|nr:unnamed protein product [Peniophora sp. CBMAI 1063]